MSTFRNCAVFCLLALCAASLVLADDITNGGFESGYFRSWNVNNQSYGSGSFIVGRGTISPLSGHPTVGPASGTFYAVLDQTGPGANALTFVFTVPPSPSVVLVFDMFVNDWSGAGPIVNPAGLDYRAFPNQHARVDILTATAQPFSIDDADVLKNLYLGVDSGANPHPYTHYQLDITDVVGDGGTFQLRFGSVDNLFYQTVGVDNVHIYRGREAGTPELPPFTDTPNTNQ